MSVAFSGAVRRNVAVMTRKLLHTTALPGLALDLQAATT